MKIYLARASFALHFVFGLLVTITILGFAGEAKADR